MNSFFIAGGSLGFILIAWGLLSSYYPRRNKTDDQYVVNTIAGSALSEVVGNRFRILSADELIDCLGLNPLIDNIRDNIPLSEETWPIDGLPFIHAYIEFVQRLPASESHHHAGDGGLIRHTLEVAYYALLAAKSSSWPPQASTEDKNSKSAVWLYGIFIAAMLHDVGKTRSNYKIMLYPEADSLSGFEWISDTGTMTEAGARYYTVGFHEKAAPHEFHGRIAWMYFLKLVPAHTRSWMARLDPSLVDILREYLTTDYDKKRKDIPFHKLISQADSQSTQNDLKHGSRKRFKSAVRPAFIEILMQAARSIVLDLHYYGLNEARAYSGGSVFRKGPYIFFTSQTLLDALYKYVLETDSSYKMPEDSNRVLDTFREYDVNEANPHKPDQNIIWIRYLLKKEDGSKKHNLLSTICFKTAILYPDNPDKVPAEYVGELDIPVPAEVKNEKAAAKAAQKELAKKKEPVKEPVSETADLVIADPQNDSLENMFDDSTGDNGFEPESDNLVPENRKNDLSEPENVIGVPENVISEQNTHEPANFSLADLASDVVVTEDELPVPEAVKTEPLPSPENQHSEPEKPSGPNNYLTEPVKKNQLVQAEGIIKSEPENKSEHNNVKRVAKEKRINLAAMLAKTGSGHNHDLPAETPAPEEAVQPIKMEKGSECLKKPTLLKEPEYLEDEQAAQSTHNEEFKGTSPSPVRVREDMMVEQYSSPKPRQLVQDIKQHNRVNDDQYSAGNRFLNFLADGLANGTLEYNTSSSSVHFVKDGMLLMTPKIFSLYTGVKFDRTREDSPGKIAQKAFEVLRIHKAREKGNSKTAHWNVNNNKDHSGRGFHAYLIPEDKLYRIIQATSRPANNPHLALFDISPKKEE